LKIGRITPSFRQLYEEIISELRTELQAAMGNSTLPTVSDKLNVMASIHNRKLIAALSRELKEKDPEIQELRQTVTALENKLNELSSKQQL
jgi:polyhydroxyalkanoate synthesis regulator phasin